MSAVVKTPVVAELAAAYGPASAKRAAGVANPQTERVKEPPVEEAPEAEKKPQQPSAASQPVVKESKLAAQLAPEYEYRPTQLRFEMDKEADRVIIKVVDRESGEVIRQIPPEEMLNMAKVLDELKGSLVDQVT